MRLSSKPVLVVSCFGLAHGMIIDGGSGGINITLRNQLGTHSVPNVLVFPSAWRPAFKAKQGITKIEDICESLTESTWGLYGIPDDCDVTVNSNTRSAKVSLRIYFAVLSHCNF